MTPTEIVHTEESVNDLIKFIKKLDGETRIVMEATGAYHFPLVEKFLEVGLFVTVINPYVMKKYACAAVRWGKTDKMDSVRIANYGIDNWFKLQEFKTSDEYTKNLKYLAGSTLTTLK